MAVDEGGQLFKMLGGALALAGDWVVGAGQWDAHLDQHVLGGRQDAERPCAQCM